LPYFNALAGGPENGWRFLADSNTDWGQTLKALAAYQEENDLGPVKLSQFTFLDPAIYGVAYEPIAPMRDAPPVLPRRFNPAPGLYAISATTLDGVPLPLPSTFDWFRHREPFVKIGYAMFLYEVQAETAAWVAQCASPSPPLPSDIVVQAFGLETSGVSVHVKRDLTQRGGSGGGRQVHFDCGRSWIFPDGGQTPGWYVHAPTETMDKLESLSGLGWLWGARQVDEHLDWYPDWIQREDLVNMQLSYVQAAPGELPPFAVWRWQPKDLYFPRTPGVALGETLRFLGISAPDIVQRGEDFEARTYWRVIAPPQRPLSLMFHLVNADNVPVVVDDGLGIPIDQWEAGDIIIQSHQFAIPSELAPGLYEIQTGAYWLDTMDRWDVSDTQHRKTSISIEIKK
jgi:hypothetical protein